jgi:two-component system sensor kinase FixL
MNTSSPNQANLFEALLNAAVDAIIIIDQNGSILSFNPAAQKMFGYSEDDILGENVHILMPEPHRSQHNAYLETYQQTGQARIIGIGRDEWGLRKSGEAFPMRLSVGEAKFDGVVRYVGIIHDQSQHHETEAKLHALEQQLFHAERLVTLGELTAGIAHEINQPLTAIAAYADAGARMQKGSESSGGPDHQVICQKISGQARRAGQVVDRLRSLVRGTHVSKSQHDVRQLIRNVLTVFEHELKGSGITLELDFQENTPDVFVDDIQVQQIIVNLVKNSIDSIRETNRPPGIATGHIVISVKQDQSSVLISVQDNGVGVSEDHRQKLFEPFFTSKPKGFGLGLSICRNIAALHGGRLYYSQPQVESGDEGEGAVFTLALPLATIG